VAKKHPKRAATKKAASKPLKTARPSAGKAATKATAAAKAPTRAAARPASAPAGPALGERAERLRDEILRSKLTHPDPWTYAPKARAWGERAQILVETIVIQGHTPAVLRTLEALAAEVQRDRDFQEARRLF
jgi:hypothetical protein